MCYPKPGPRCTAHARTRLTEAQNALSEAREANVGVSAAETRLRDAKMEWFTTPGGQKELREQVKSLREQGKDNEAVVVQQKLSQGTRLRRQQMAEYQVSVSENEIVDLRTKQVEWETRRQNGEDLQPTHPDVVARFTVTPDLESFLSMYGSSGQVTNEVTSERSDYDIEQDRKYSEPRYIDPDEKEEEFYFPASLYTTSKVVDAADVEAPSLDDIVSMQPRGFDWIQARQMMPVELQKKWSELGLDDNEMFDYDVERDYYGPVVTPFLSDRYGAAEKLVKFHEYYHTLDGASDPTGVKDYVAAKTPTVDMTGKTPLAVLKESLTLENNGRTSALVEHTNTMATQRVQLDRITVTTPRHYNRVEAREPVPVTPGSPVIAGVLVKQIGGELKLVDGYHRLRHYRDNTDNKSANYIVLDTLR